MIIYLQMIETGEDKSKFEQIYKEYRGLMYHVAFARLHHAEDAEDVVHHAFVKIAENIRKIEPVSTRTKRLVVTIVDNRVTDLLRARGRHSPPVCIDDFADVLSEEVSENGLAACIFQLPDLQRQILWLKYNHGYTLREIAKMTGISLACAQKTEQRAKQKLKEMYEKEGKKE